MTEFEVSTDLEAGGYDYYEYHLNKGGGIECDVSRSARGANGVRSVATS